MKPPRPFKRYSKRAYGQCDACGKWKLSNNIFYHGGYLFHLCLTDWVDYWENLDELLPDFKDYDFKAWG